MEEELRSLLKEKGADAVHFVDVSTLPESQTMGLPRAVLIRIALSKDFVLDIYHGKNFERNDFTEKERKTDALADWLAEALRGKGYRAESQSEACIEKNNRYRADAMSSALPHKTVARIAGIGFIGKNDLLIAADYGCGFSMCSVLTDAPFITENRPPIPPKCGDCRQCKAICPHEALSGNVWTETGGREALMDVRKCNCPLKCLAQCPWTLKYANSPV